MDEKNVIFNDKKKIIKANNKHLIWKKALNIESIPDDELEVQSKAWEMDLRKRIASQTTKKDLTAKMRRCFMKKLGVYNPPQRRIRLSRDVSKGLEPIRTRAYREHEAEPEPNMPNIRKIPKIKKFDYIRENIDRTGTMDMEDDELENYKNGPRICCTCTDGCISDACKCKELNELLGGIQYKGEKLRVPGRHEQGVYLSCSRLCQCHQTGCERGIIQQPLPSRQLKFEIFNTIHSDGFGIRTLCNIEEGEIVFELTGEVRREQEVDQRKVKSKVIALFRLGDDDSEDTPSSSVFRWGLCSAKTYGYSRNQRKEDWCNTYLDTSEKGNIARFVRHGCLPNVRIVRTISSDDIRPSKLRILLVACEPIIAGSEILLNYGPNHRLGNLEKCRCGTIMCRRYHSRLWVIPKPGVRDQMKSVVWDRRQKLVREQNELDLICDNNSIIGQLLNELVDQVAVDELHADNQILEGDDSMNEVPERFEEHFDIEEEYQQEAMDNQQVMVDDAEGLEQVFEAEEALDETNDQNVMIEEEEPMENVRLDAQYLDGTTSSSNRRQVEIHEAELNDDIVDAILEDDSMNAGEPIDTEYPELQQHDVIASSNRRSEVDNRIGYTIYEENAMSVEEPMQPEGLDIQQQEENAMNVKEPMEPENQDIRQQEEMASSSNRNPKPYQAVSRSNSSSINSGRKRKHDELPQQHRQQRSLAEDLEQFEEFEDLPRALENRPSDQLYMKKVVFYNNKERRQSNLDYQTWKTEDGRKDEPIDEELLKKQLEDHAHLLRKDINTSIHYKSLTDEMKRVFCENLKPYCSPKKRWLINADLAVGHELEPVPLYVDSGTRASCDEFEYIEKNYSKRRIEDIVSDSSKEQRYSICCSCEDGCASETCECFVRNQALGGAQFKGGRFWIKGNYDDSIFLFCGPSCACGKRESGCERGNMDELPPNRDVQFEIFKKSDKHGFGVRSMCNISEGEPVAEIVGELLTDEELLAKSKEHQYYATEQYNADSDNPELLKALRYGSNSDEWNSRLYISSYEKSNLTRFFRHGCYPNVRIFKFCTSNDMRPRNLRVLTVACQPIVAGSELLLNYGKAHEASLASKCSCGTIMCTTYRGYWKIMKKVHTDPMIEVLHAHRAALLDLQTTVEDLPDDTFEKPRRRTTTQRNPRLSITRRTEEPELINARTVHEREDRIELEENISLEEEDIKLPLLSIPIAEPPRDQADDQREDESAESDPSDL